MDEELVELSVLSEIVPSKEEMERLDSIAGRLLEVTRSYFGKKGLDVDVRLAGSYAKGSYLRDQDFDLFMMFPMNTPKKEMMELGLQAGKDIIGGELVYSEHPYTTGFFEGIETDMVPCYKLPDTSHIRTAVDRTPFHTLYMNSPERYLPNMAADHPYIDIYNQKDIIICIGQGAWEDGLGSQFFLQSVFEKKGINAWFDYWGFDVNHDWPWWKKQMRYFLPVLLEEHGL